MNIYYFNLTYTCNSDCVFCYSHNTLHSGNVFREITFQDFSEYIRERGVCETDRVIINGGEPLLHTQFLGIIDILKKLGCETLIYTNGRLLDRFNFGFLGPQFRFVIPIHGYKELHDQITRRVGSYDQMVLGIDHLQKYCCLVDVKIIMNNSMIRDDIEFGKTVQSIDKLNFNNAIQITKMADTIVSLKNGCESISLNAAAEYTSKLFDYYKGRAVVLKIFDTCIKKMKVTAYNDNLFVLKVFFKDYAQEWDFRIKAPSNNCRNSCTMSRFCASAVDDYRVLEYKNGKFYKGLE